MARTAKPARRTQPAWLTTLAASIPVRVALLALLAALAYGASLSSGVAWDDAEQLSANPSIRSLERPWRFFTDPSTATPYGGAFMSQYRPLRTLLFAVEFALFRGHAWGYHLVSLLLHGLGAFAVARLTRALFGRGEFLAAAIWLVHPALSDSVLYLAAQGNLLCVLGVLLAWRSTPATTHSQSTGCAACSKSRASVHRAGRAASPSRPVPTNDSATADPPSRRPEPP
jgi:hypothetical protein